MFAKSLRRFLRRVERVEALRPGCFKQLRRGGNKDDLRTLKHVARNQGRSQLQRVGPAEIAPIKQLPCGLKHSRIQGLLHHARGFKAQNVERRVGILGRDGTGTLAPADRAVDLKRGGGGDELAVVLDGFHQPDQGVGALLLYEQLRKRRGLKKVAAHRFPRSSSMASAMESP